MTGDARTARAMSQTERLEKWWDSLGEEQRTHARACVRANLPDSRFRQTLRDAGIGLANVGWVSSGAPGEHIPRAIQRFVDARPVGS